MDRMSPDNVPLDVPRPTIGVRWGSSSLSLSTLDDPRSSSTQSLLPSPSENDDSGRRRLLVIYIHGFMGNDASFQSFPAHVHKCLKLALSETHTVHSKIYPRYKTYKALDVARDNFSRWLAPHESPTTDVVLVGHSMGGLLAADVALMPSRNQYQMGYFLHRIIGTVNLDAPLLGLHASVVTAGIASLFRPKSDTANLPEEPIPEDESAMSLSNINSANTSIYSDPSSASQSPRPQGIPYGMTFDPNFNPSFVNDAPLRDRGWWKNIVHFVEKHNSEGLLDAVSHHLMSHLEFGSCLMDLNNLKTRYENIRRLEDVDDLKDHGFPHVPPQVRFIQYYTVCHGYPKKPKGPGSNNNSEASETILNTRSTSSTPQTSIQGHDHPPSTQDLDATNSNTLLRDSFDGNSESPELQLLAPVPMSEEPQSIPETSTFDEPLKDVKDRVPENGISVNHSDGGDTEVLSQQPHNNSSSQQSSDNDIISTTDLTDAVASLGIGLPTIPELPIRPEPPDFSQYTDKDVRKQAEKEAKRMQKDYDRLVKDRDKAVRERQKIYDKRKKKLAQETEKKVKEEQKQRKKEAAAIAASSSSNSDDGPLRNTSSTVAQSEGPNVASPLASPSAQSRGKAKPPKPPKERKFCNVPKVNGEVDPKWVKIFMKDMDQVAAHTSLFFRGEHYEKLVGDVGETVVNWVQDDMTKRAILEME
ncbi:hypothetical protein F4813DRAFT_232548 [Daldinia decipiens]|uniref:uncharacterized protein n=1 Tax=Daldinia decipiens TaxID=326647 RepID=UPI0020C45FCE|nr:uncharacterized protein F4813DRAFT_232548 [Daldinia decipiens]KAI1654049.1 hypothetical protein F4813DRAFT_232548 [Daldinia decipiens]